MSQNSTSSSDGKPQRDWLSLLIIPGTLIVITGLFGLCQVLYSFQLSDLQHNHDIALAADQQRETSVDNYLNNMSVLLSNPDLRSATAKDGPDLRSLARSQTLTVLSELSRDGVRKARIVLFLHDANLINRGDSSLKFPVVSLAGADLRWSTLSGMNLGGANLAAVNLGQVDLSRANLNGAYLSNAILYKANLESAHLPYAQLTEGVNLEGADLKDADLSGADLSGADLSTADPNSASPSKTDLTGARLIGADLTGANLQGAIVTKEQLGKATITQWKVTQNANILQMYYNAGNTLTQYGALDLNSSYLRLIYGPQSGWGTSIILLPSFWNATPVLCKKGSVNTYCQGPPVIIPPLTQIDVSTSNLFIPMTSTIAGLQVNLELHLSKPATDSISAEVKATIVSGGDTLKLDTHHHGEAFKPVMLSSMYSSQTQWDSSQFYTDNRNATSYPKGGWIMQPPELAQKFGLMGGTSAWKTNAPTLEIQLKDPQALMVTGWIQPDNNPNDDNVGFWCASPNETLVASWSYTVTASHAQNT